MASPAHERAKVANACRHGHDSEAIAAARSELRAAVAEKYIREIVDAAPPLSPEQRSRLAVLLLAPAAS